MKKPTLHTARRTGTSGLLVVMVMLAAFRLAADKPEPSYQGKTLNQWLEASIVWTEKGASWNMPEEAVTAIREMGTNALPMLLQMLGEADPRPSKDGGSGHGNESVKTVGLGPAARSREKAVLGLLVLQHDAYPAIPSLLRLMKRPEKEVQIATDQFFWPTGPFNWDRRAIPATLPFLKDESEHVRFRAAHLLETIEDPPAELLPAIMPLLGDSSDVVRSTAISIIGNCGRDAKEAVPALLKATRDKVWRVQHEAAIALHKIGAEPEVVIPILIATLENRPETTCASDAIGALQHYGPRAKQAVPILQKIARSTQWHGLDEMAKRALEEIDPEPTTEK
jgi:hypothetical protein